MSGRQRVAWIDAARGTGIVLVVLGHAAGGLIDSPLGVGQGGLRLLFFAIYLFHMPLFFLLSGLFVAERLARGPAPFLRGLVPALVWPYFLWSTVQFAVICALGALVNRPAGAFLPTVLALPWRTVSQFWFLYALFWMHVLAAGTVQRVGAGALVALGLAGKLAAALVQLDVTVRLVANNLVWYALGVALTAPGAERLLGRGGPARLGARLAAIAVLAATLALARRGLAGSLASGASPVLANLAWRLWAIPAAVAGTWLVLLAGRRSGAAGLAARLGRHTMAIFVLHVLFIAGLRILLVRQGLASDPWLLLAPLAVAGLVGPLLAERMLCRLGLRRLLGL